MNKSSQIILDLKNIDKSYGETKVLENINISIYDNEFFTLLGPLTKPAQNGHFLHSVQNSFASRYITLYVPSR